MEIRIVSSLLKKTFYCKMSETMEIASNIWVKFFDLNVRHRGSQPSIFVRSFRSFTISVIRGPRDDTKIGAWSGSHAAFIGSHGLFLDRHLKQGQLRHVGSGFAPAARGVSGNIPVQ